MAVIPKVRPMVTTEIAITSKKKMKKANLLAVLIITFSIAQVSAKIVNGCKQLMSSP